MYYYLKFFFWGVFSLFTNIHTTLLYLIAYPLQLILTLAPGSIVINEDKIFPGQAIRIHHTHKGAQRYGYRSGRSAGYPAAIDQGGG